MKLNAHRTVNPDAARRWPRLNAGSRRQVELPMTGIRHFRAGPAAVKHPEHLSYGRASYFPSIN